MQDFLFLNDVKTTIVVPYSVLPWQPAVYYSEELQCYHGDLPLRHLGELQVAVLQLRLMALGLFMLAQNIL